MASNGPKKAQTFGVDANQEMNPNQVRMDARTLGERFEDFITQPVALISVYYAFALMILTMPGVWWLWFMMWGFMHLVYFEKASKRRMPMRLPIVHKFWMEKWKKIPFFGKRLYEFGIKDYNVPMPNWTDYEEAKGFIYLGRERTLDGSKKIYAGSDDILTHVLLFGTTGSGKTETLLGMSFNSLAIGSGMVFVDPKGTNELALKIYTMARMFARDDDYLLINYATGNEKIEPFSHKRKSNTTNPFARGTADFLSDILVSLLPPSQGDNAYFQEGAITLIKSAMYGLVEMRDQGRLNLSVRTIRQWLTLEKLLELVKDESLSTMARESLLAYLQSVPGLKIDKSVDEQEPQTLIQYGYNSSYFRRPLSALTDTYGHVYGSLMGEVDFKDVVFNRRILLVLLPSMEKSPEELKSLGKIILSAIRSAVALGTGNVFEGSEVDMLKSLPISKRKPTLFILDEYGYVSVDGFAVLPAQARGLGAAFVFAGQDYAGFRRGSETEAEQIIANTKIKIFMTLEDVKDTWELAKTLAGEAIVYSGSQREIRETTVIGEFEHMRSASMERITRVDLNDLRQQISGDFHIFYKENIIRGHALYVPLDVSGGMRINRYCEVDTPEPVEIERRYGNSKIRSEIFNMLLNGKKGRSVLAKIIEKNVGDDTKLMEIGEIYDRVSEAKNEISFIPDGIAAATWYALMREDEREIGKGGGEGRKARNGMEVVDESEGLEPPDDGFDIDEQESFFSSGAENTDIAREAIREVIELDELDDADIVSVIEAGKISDAIEVVAEDIKEDMQENIEETKKHYPSQPKPDKKNLISGHQRKVLEESLSEAGELGDILSKI